MREDRERRKVCSFFPFFKKKKERERKRGERGKKP